jgi:hypothetical protein
MATEIAADLRLGTSGAGRPETVRRSADGMVVFIGLLL